MASVVACSTRIRQRLDRRMLALLTVLPLVICLAGCGVSSDPSVIARNDTAVLLPSLSAGTAGWCLLALSEVDLGGCPTTRTGTPIIAETWQRSGSETMGVDVTSGEVTAVSFNGGTPIATRAEAGLPDGMRGVVWVIHGETRETPGFPPRPTPLDKHGHVLHQTSYSLSRSVGGRGLLVEVPSGNAEGPGDSSLAPCAIRAAHMKGLVVEGARVVKAVRVFHQLLGEAFLACANTEYTLARWPMGASVLIDAAHPGATPPALPLVKPVARHPGVFEEPGQLGRQVSRRIPGGWLVAWGGKTQAARLQLLADIHATAP